VYTLRDVHVADNDNAVAVRTSEVGVTAQGNKLLLSRLKLKPIAFWNGPR
jgi:hypothetical protein